MKQIPLVPLRALREAHGLSSIQLAERIAEHGVSVHPDSVINVELGRKRASARLIHAWARALGVHPLDVRQPDAPTRAGS